MPRSQQPPTPDATHPRFTLDSNVTWGIVMLVLGYSGAFADNSFALYLVGVALLSWGIFRSVRPPKPSTQPDSDARPDKKKDSRPAQDGLRETVESLVVAFILAFLFRSFEAEAFVIPTGSMAPTLLGRHKDVNCEECGYFFTVGASQEVDGDSGRLIDRLEEAVCPNCRFRNDVKALPPFPGDRIVVTKLYQPPRRFDVIVFKYPEEPHVNYIKRCVGLPNETITIMHGDLFRREAEGDEWQVLRKRDPDKQQAIQIVVYDDKHHSRTLEAAGWPLRWAGVEPVDSSESPTGWRETADGFQRDGTASRYTATATSGQYQWLRYRHIVAGQEDWLALRDNQAAQPVARLISDFCGYNMFSTENMGHPRLPADHGLYWVGDLTVEFTADLENISEDSQLVVELVEGLSTYRARINCATGQLVVTRTWEGQETEVAAAATAITADGSYRLRFANVDDRLAFWVNGRSVDLGEGCLLARADSHMPTSRDLSPAGIAITGMKGSIADLILYRDIYYRDEVAEYQEVAAQDHLEELLHVPDEWYRAYSSGRRRRDESMGAMTTYVMGDDEYLMFGDNSPQSKDSRLFDQIARFNRGGPYTRHAVRSQAIIGKAFFVYWPHGKPFLNDGQGYPFPLSYHVDREGRKVPDYPNHRIPFYPSVERMRRIR